MPDRLPFPGREVLPVAREGRTAQAVWSKVRVAPPRHPLRLATPIKQPRLADAILGEQ